MEPRFNGGVGYTFGEFSPIIIINKEPGNANIIIMARDHFGFLFTEKFEINQRENFQE